MAFFSTPQERKSSVLTLIVTALLFLTLFFIKFWPPSDYKGLAGGGGGGVAVNFGNSDFGKGQNFQSDMLDVSQTIKAIEQVSSSEDILTQEDSDTDIGMMSTPKKETPKKPTPTKTETKVTAPTKPTTPNNSALNNILNSKNTGGDGNDNTSGNKGSLSGDRNSSSYYGSGGSGGGSGGGHGTGSGTGYGEGSGSGSGGGSGNGYSLGNRKNLTKPAPQYTCNETGTVVLEIKVDRNGQTQSATVTRGTTNPATCLTQQAIRAAMATKWESDPNAPTLQTGKIIYNFSLN